jgi:hypothetical protein
MTSPPAGADAPGAKSSDRQGEGAASVRTEREARLAKALRDNLRRRKGLQKPEPGRQDPG